MAKKRPISIDAWSGMVLVDKPLGLSSQQLVTRVKRMSEAQRAGHTGTLDPLASGLLPVCLNEGTKFASYLLAQDKQYIATVQLGTITDTGDLAGTVLHTHTGKLASIEEITALLPKFVGEQDQVPPRYAAIKFEGKKYYEYAREGIEIERPTRRITIFSIQLLSLENQHLTIEVHCSSGTYIRSLAEDIGEALGCGATLSALRRTKIGHWDIQSALTLETITPPLPGNEVLAPPDAWIPCDAMVGHLPACAISTEEVRDLYLGKPLTDRDETNGLYRLFHGMITPKSFVGLADIESKVLRSRRLLATVIPSLE
ncbi:MAG: tRNA pseudouridine(55) synthase TruB [Pseudomonadota bacterium]